VSIGGEMARPRKIEGEERTSERLLDAALVELGAHGFEGMRLFDIAFAVGITRPSLIHHFANKEELYRATVARAFARLALVLRAAMAGESDDEIVAVGPAEFRARFFSVVDAFARFMFENDALARLIVRELIADASLGREILIATAVPLVDEIEQFVSRAGGTSLPIGLPVRALVLTAVADVLLRVSSGRDLEGELWGRGSTTWDVISRVLAPEETPAARHTRAFAKARAPRTQAPHAPASKTTVKKR
jgi:AcrR family transcriptional regulator